MRKIIEYCFAGLPHGAHFIERYIARFADFFKMGGSSDQYSWTTLRIAQTDEVPPPSDDA